LCKKKGEEMKYFLRLGFVLFVITAIASGVLAYINSFTGPIIAENQKKVQGEARKEVLPSAVKFVPDSVSVEKIEEKDPLKKTSKDTNNLFRYYRCYDENDNFVGYTFEASLYGYSSEVKTMVGVGPDFTVGKIKTISQSETPGLGANCMKEDVQKRFFHKKKDELVVDKDGGTIKSITGATITTRTIANSIKNGLEILEKNIKKTPVEIDVEPVVEETK